MLRVVIENNILNFTGEVVKIDVEILINFHQKHPDFVANKS